MTSEDSSLDEQDRRLDELRAMVQNVLEPLWYSNWLGRPHAEWKVARDAALAELQRGVASDWDRENLEILLRESFYWEGTPYEHKMVDRNGVIVSDDPYADPAPVGFAHLEASLESDRWADKSAEDFWSWWDAQAAQVEAMADDSEMADVQARLKALRQTAAGRFRSPGATGSHADPATD